MAKKLLALTVALVMMLSLVSCFGGNDDKDVPSDDHSAETITGTVVDNNYSNSFLGIKCTLDSTWGFLSDEEIKAQNEATIGLVGDDYADAIKNASVVYDMMAVNENQTDTVIVNMEKLTGLNTALTEEGYVELTVDSLVEELESMGVENVSHQTGTVTFAGADHAAIHISGEYAGINVYELLVCSKKDNYMAVFVACTWYNDATYDLLDTFEPID